MRISSKVLNHYAALTSKGCHAYQGFNVAPANTMTETAKRLAKLSVMQAALIAIAVVVGLELIRNNMAPDLSPYSVSEWVLTLAFPLAMLTIHAVFRPNFPYFHIGRELSWLGIAVLVSLVALVLGTKGCDAVAVLSPFPSGYRPIALLFICLFMIGSAVFCEVACRIIWEQANPGQTTPSAASQNFLHRCLLRVNAFLRRFSRVALEFSTFIVGEFLYIAASAMLVTSH